MSEIKDKYQARYGDNDCTDFISTEGKDLNIDDTADLLNTLTAKLAALEAERDEANRVRDDNIRIAVAYVDAFSQVEHERDEAKKELLFALADRKVLRVAILATTQWAEQRDFVDGGNDSDMQIIKLSRYANEMNNAIVEAAHILEGTGE